VLRLAFLPASSPELLPPAVVNLEKLGAVRAAPDPAPGPYGIVAPLVRSRNPLHSTTRSDTEPTSTASVEVIR
jgi:hypothetical protein